MKNKRITRAVSVVMLLALLVSLLPMAGMVGTVSAETAASKATPAPEPETVEATEETEEEQPTETPTETAPVEETEPPAISEETREPTDEQEPEPVEPEEPDPKDAGELIPSDDQITPSPTGEDLITLPGDGAIAAPTATSSGTMTVPYWINLDSSFTLSYKENTSGVTHNASINAMHIRYITDTSRGGKYPAYCLEPQLGSGNNRPYTGNEQELTEEDAWKNALSVSQRSAIMLAMAYAEGWLKLDNNRARTIYDEAAVQVLVWEFLSKQRDPITFQVKTGSTANNETQLFTNVFNHMYSVLNTSTNGYSQINTAQRNAAKTLYHEVVDRIAKHDKIPSFSSDNPTNPPVHTMTYDAATGKYTVVLTDTNNVLADYDFTVSGCTVTRNGNTLTITTSDADAVDGIICSAAGHSFNCDLSNSGVIIYSPGSSTLQACVCYTAPRPDPVMAYFRLDVEDTPGTMTMRKALEAGRNGDLEGFCFRLFCYNTGGLWYGKSDQTGDIYQTDASFVSTGTYTFSGLLDGTYALRELLSMQEHYEYRTKRVTVTTEGGSTAPVSLTYEGDALTYTADGDCTIGSIPITGLTGGGTMTIEIINEPVPCELTIHKTSDDGMVGGISFKIESFEDHGWSETCTLETDANGELHTTFSVGQKLRITELVPEGYVCLSENPQIIDYLDAEHCTVSFENALIKGSLHIVKVDRASREPLEGAGFRLYDSEGNQIAEGYTDQDGSLEFSDLIVGEYEYQEFQAPDGFVLDDSRYPFSVTAEYPDIEIEAENDIMEGAIRVHKINEKGQPMAGVVYLLEYSSDDGASWLPIGNRDPDDPVTVGCCTNDDSVDGVIQTGADGWAEYPGLAINSQLCNIMYRLTEVKTWDGYQLLTEPVFEGYLTAELTEIERTAVNHPTFQMPMTGSDGFTAAGIGFGLCLLASVLLLLFLPKKREDMNNG